MFQHKLLVAERPTSVVVQSAFAIGNIVGNVAVVLVGAVPHVHRASFNHCRRAVVVKIFVYVVPEQFAREVHLTFVVGKRKFVVSVVVHNHAFSVYFAFEFQRAVLVANGKGVAFKPYLDGDSVAVLRVGALRQLGAVKGNFVPVHLSVTVQTNGVCQKCVGNVRTCDCFERQRVPALFVSRFLGAGALVRAHLVGTGFVCAFAAGRADVFALVLRLFGLGHDKAACGKHRQQHHGKQHHRNNSD